MANADKRNITLRRNIPMPLTAIQMDNNFDELINNIDDLELHLSASDPHPQYVNDVRFSDLVDGLTADDITEGSTNKYFDKAYVDNQFSNLTTDDVPEGSTNKYFDQSVIDNLTTDDVPEGENNKYFDPDFVTTAIGNVNTDGVPEGDDNLYFTNDRVRSYLDNNSISSGINWRVLPANALEAQVVNREGLLTDTRFNQLTVTLPASPQTGDHVRFVDAGGVWSVNNLRVEGNGKTVVDNSYIEGDVDHGNFGLVYNGSRWTLIT